MEGKWIHKIFSDICDENKLEDDYKNYLISMLDKLNTLYEGLGFCLSELGDSLSQWRGYAQEAEGFCLGFSKEGLQTLEEKMREDEKHSFDLIQVNYDIARQRQELQPTYQKIKELIDEGAFDSKRSIMSYAMASEEELKEEENKRMDLENKIRLEAINMIPKFFQQKNPAFKEEKEWRAVSDLLKFRMFDIEFRPVGDRLVPYRPLEFDPKIIAEVILGPKNQTPIDIVEAALQNFGYEGVSVKSSEATYR